MSSGFAACDCNLNDVFIGTGQGNELDKQTRDQTSSRRGSGTDRPPVPEHEATQDRSKPIPVPSVPDEDVKAPPTKSNRRSSRS